MTDFQEWWEVRKAKSQGMYDAKSLSEAAFLAGQASAEQRVKWQDDLIQELQAKCAELERERDQWKYTAEIRQQHLEYTIKAQAGEPVGYHFSYTTPFGHVVWAIDYTPRPDAIEVYPLVRAHPTTEPVKAQAGEPESNLAAFFKLDEQAMELIHPTTERRVIPEDVLSWIDGVLPVVEIFGTTPSQKQWSRDRTREARAWLNAAPAPTKEMK